MDAVGRGDFLKFLLKDATKYLNAPGLPREAEGGMAMAWPGCMLHQVLSLLVSLYSLRSPELPATTEGESSRGGSP